MSTLVLCRPLRGGLRRLVGRPLLPWATSLPSPAPWRAGAWRPIQTGFGCRVGKDGTGTRGSTRLPMRQRIEADSFLPFGRWLAALPQFVFGMRAFRMGLLLSGRWMPLRTVWRGSCGMGMGRESCMGGLIGGKGDRLADPLGETVLSREGEAIV